MAQADFGSVASATRVTQVGLLEPLATSMAMASMILSSAPTGMTLPPRTPAVPPLFLAAHLGFQQAL